MNTAGKKALKNVSVPEFLHMMLLHMMRYYAGKAGRERRGDDGTSVAGETEVIMQERQGGNGEANAAINLQQSLKADGLRPAFTVYGLVYFTISFNG